MAKSFSEREVARQRVEIIDAAPRWLRENYYDRVLKGFLAELALTQFDYERQISPSKLVEKLASWMEGVPDPIYRQLGQGSRILKEILLDTHWFFFYDLIELVAALLQQKDQAARLKQTNEGGLPPIFIAQFSRFRTETNELFDDSCVGWVLDRYGFLNRVRTLEIMEVERANEAGLEKASAIIALGNARKFLNEKPCDAANSIKESVSALESVARDLSTSSKTLGEAVKVFGREEKYPKLLLSMIEKLYGFASSEPGVRHGSPDPHRVTRAEAEFIYVASQATIKFLREYEK